MVTYPRYYDENHKTYEESDSIIEKLLEKIIELSNFYGLSKFPGHDLFISFNEYKFDNYVIAYPVIDGRIISSKRIKMDTALIMPAIQEFEIGHWYPQLIFQPNNVISDCKNLRFEINLIDPVVDLKRQISGGYSYFHFRVVNQRLPHFLIDSFPNINCLSSSIEIPRNLKNKVFRLNDCYKFWENKYCVFYADDSVSKSDFPIKILYWCPIKREETPQINYNLFFIDYNLRLSEDKPLYSFMINNNSRILFGRFNSESEVSLLGTVSIFFKENFQYPKSLLNIKII